MDSERWHRLRTRLYLHLVGLKRRMTIGTRAMLLDGDRIYLVRHTYLPGWHFPGGGIEPGESAAASVAREVMEETGCRLTAPPELFGLYHNTHATNRDHVAFYVCRSVEQAKPFKANYEIAEFGWFPRDALPSGTSAGTRRRLAEVFQGAAKSEAW